MPTYRFATSEVISCCSKCPMLSYDSKSCGLGMDGPYHWDATHMLDHPEWLFDHRPGWCMLSEASAEGNQCE